MAVQDIPIIATLPEKYADLQPFLDALIREIIGPVEDTASNAAVDSTVVKLAEAQTITGAKTFGEDLAITSGKTLKVGGVQVLADQQPAVADAAVTATAPPGTGPGALPGAFDSQATRDAVLATVAALQADVVTLKDQLNTSLARQRSHGLIAP